MQILYFLCGTLTFPLAYGKYMCLHLVYVYLCICLDFEINSYGRPPFQLQIPSHPLLSGTRSLLFMT